MKLLAALGVGAATAAVVLAACVGDDGASPANSEVDAGTDTGTPSTTPADTGAGAPDVVTTPVDSGGDLPETSTPVDSGTDAGTDAGLAFGGVTGISLWLAADTNVTADGTGNVQAWQPKAGPTLVFSPVQNAAAPTKNLINSKKTIHFAGVTGSANCGCPGLVADVASTFDQPLTMFVVGQADRITDGTFAYDGVFLRNVTSTFTLGLINKAANSPFWMVNAGTELDGSGIAGADLAKLHVFSAVVSGTSSSLRVDGTPSTNTDVGLGSLTGQMVLGTGAIGTQSLEGELGEILFFNGAMPLSDVLKVEAALKTEWSLQ